LGERRCIKCDTVVKKDSIESIISYINDFEDDKKFMIKAPIKGFFSDFDEIKREVLDL
jgi:hypothetical protein